MSDARPALAAPARPSFNPFAALQRWLFGGNTIVKVGIGILFVGLAFLARFASEHVQVPVELRLAAIATVATLVPDLANERARFGLALLGAWSENEAVARRLEAERRAAEWQPWLLWAVLLLGIAGLGFMVWRLAAAGREPPRGASRPDTD